MSGPPRRVRATLDGRVVELDVSDAGTVSLQQDGQPITLDVALLGEVSGGGRRLSIAHPSGEPSQAIVVQVGDEVWVSVDADVFVLEIEAAQQTPTRRRAKAEGALVAPMPATVMRILVSPGQTVTRGETLLLLEAMKMELPVRAPRDGRVKAVLCNPGELVQPGVALVAFDSDE